MPRTRCKLAIPAVLGLLVFALVAEVAARSGGGAPDSGSTSAPLSLDMVAERALRHGFPAIVLAADIDGDVSLAAAGWANLRERTPMTSTTPFPAASTTKPVTAAAVLLLVDRGELSLDALLPDVLPPDVVELVPRAERIRVRDLLFHTSGIYSPNNDPRYLARYIGPERWERPFWSAREIVAFAASPENPPVFEPGEGKAYGDINYVLASLVVSHVSGREFRRFVHEEIFAPLGMNATVFLSEAPRGERARGYTVDSPILRELGLDPELVADEAGLVDTTELQEKSDGAAGLLTTAPDLLRFARALVRGDLLSERSRELVLELEEAETSGESLGILRRIPGPDGGLWTAEGDAPGYHVVWAYHPSSGRIAVAAVNLFGRFDERDLLVEEVVPGALGLGSGP